MLIPINILEWIITHLACNHLEKEVVLIRIEEDSLRTSDGKLILIQLFLERIFRLTPQEIDGFQKGFEVVT